MSGQLGKRGALMMLAAMSLAVGVGLLAWGPIPVDAASHRYADDRAWLGIPNALNVVVNLPLFWLGVWGWCATRSNGWPRPLRVPWQGFHLLAMTVALTSALYHAAPSDTLFVVSHVGQASAFAMLTLGMLAELVDARFGSSAACVSAAAAVALAGAGIVYAGRLDGAIDMRPLVLVELVPVLLIPAGALSLRGQHTTASNWLVVLMLYASAKLFDLGDAAILRLTAGLISGHSLMHLNLAIVVGWMAYCASAAGARGVDMGAVVPGSSQRQASLNTTS